MNTGKRCDRAVFLVLMVLMIMTATACSVKGQHSTVGNQTASEAPDTRSMIGVVTVLDTKSGKMTLRELETDVDSILTYNATAMITDRYDKEVSGDTLEVGQIIEATYRTGDAQLVSASVPDDVWEYREVGKFSFRKDENMMKLAGKKYQYSERTFVTSGEETLEMIELNRHDKLTVRGIGISVYSIVRTEGHGYIRLANYRDFLGGMVEVGNQIILPVTENMLITAAEGVYRLTLCKGVAVTTKTITVKRDEELLVDFSDYVPAVKNIGTITFAIEPEGADLYINGTAVDYSEPVALNYGEYQITVEMTGYDTYTGVLDVEDASETINIDLIEEEASVGEEATATPAATGEEDDESSDSDSTTKQIDSDHTISVSAPKGVEVYLDNVYKGLAPCKFTKVIGSQTITLSKAGYVTKSYAVDILDDDENVTLSFSELVAEEKSEQ